MINVKDYLIYVFMNGYIVLDIESIVKIVKAITPTHNSVYFDSSSIN